MCRPLVAESLEGTFRGYALPESRLQSVWLITPEVLHHLSRGSCRWIARPCQRVLTLTTTKRSARVCLNRCRWMASVLLTLYALVRRTLITRTCFCSGTPCRSQHAWDTPLREDRRSGCMVMTLALAWGAPWSPDGGLPPLIELDTFRCAGGLQSTTGERFMSPLRYRSEGGAEPPKELKTFVLFT